MIKKYVRGDSKNPEGVIKVLENLGALNERDMSGSHEDGIYYINRDNRVDFAVIGTEFADVAMECFEEVQPIKIAPKVITNLDMAKWYFQMLRSGHCIQFKYSHDYDTVEFIFDIPCAYVSDEDETKVKKVRIDFGEWIPIEEAGII